jgi:hypothetical protein
MESNFSNIKVEVVFKKVILSMHILKSVAQLSVGITFTVGDKYRYVVKLLSLPSFLSCITITNAGNGGVAIGAGTVADGTSGNGNGNGHGVAINGGHSHQGCTDAIGKMCLNPP